MLVASAVEHSPELERVRQLPWRWNVPDGTELLSDLWSIGEQELRELQAQALAELHIEGGLIALIRVGGGKTLITYLAAEMVDAKRPLLLVPAKLRAKTHRDFAELAKSWELTGPLPHIESYERLGRAQWADFLESYQPDLIIADEAHKLKNVQAAITRRVARWMDNHPTTHFVALSGTLTRRSLQDFVHLAEWALGQRAPVPLRLGPLREWCSVLDADVVWGRVRPGALRVFCDPHDAGSGLSELDQVRRGVRRRIIGTSGVVASTVSEVDASLNILRWKKDVPPVVKEAIDRAYAELELPNGELLVSDVERWRHVRELAQGFYYRWNPLPPEWWLIPRRRWASFVRQVVETSSKLDSPAQVAELYKNSKLFTDWERVRKAFTPNVEAVWIDKSVPEAAVAWAYAKDGIVWVEHRAMAEELVRRELPYYGRMGLCEGKPIEDARGPIGASIAANKEGRNLQHYNRNLILSPPTAGDAWEQLLGRTHRDGQQADEVEAEIYFGCGANVRAFSGALREARYQSGVTGSPQKLLEATVCLDVDFTVGASA
jgi:hypothetical protein